MLQRSEQTLVTSSNAGRKARGTTLLDWEINDAQNAKFARYALHPHCWTRAPMDRTVGGTGYVQTNHCGLHQRRFREGRCQARLRIMEGLHRSDHARDDAAAEGRQAIAGGPSGTDRDLQTGKPELRRGQKSSS